MRLTKKSKYAASFGRLRRGGILKSRRGAHGGYRLAMPAEEVTVLDIVENLYGEVRPARYSEGGGHYTDDSPPCSTSEAWDEAPVALEDALNRYSIAQLAGPSAGAAKGARAPIGR